MLRPLVNTVTKAPHGAAVVLLVAGRGRLRAIRKQADVEMVVVEDAEGDVAGGDVAERHKHHDFVVGGNIYIEGSSIGTSERFQYIRTGKW